MRIFVPWRQRRISRSVRKRLVGRPSKKKRSPSSSRIFLSILQGRSLLISLVVMLYLVVHCYYVCSFSCFVFIGATIAAPPPIPSSAAPLITQDDSEFLHKLRSGTHPIHDSRFDDEVAGILNRSLPFLKSTGKFYLIILSNCLFVLF